MLETFVTCLEHIRKIKSSEYAIGLLSIYHYKFHINTLSLYKVLVLLDLQLTMGYQPERARAVPATNLPFHLLNCLHHSKPQHYFSVFWNTPKLLAEKQNKINKLAKYPTRSLRNSHHFSVLYKIKLGDVTDLFVTNLSIKGNYAYLNIYSLSSGYWQYSWKPPVETLVTISATQFILFSQNYLLTRTERNKATVSTFDVYDKKPFLVLR